MAFITIINENFVMFTVIVLLNHFWYIVVLILSPSYGIQVLASPVTINDIVTIGESKVTTSNEKHKSSINNCDNYDIKLNTCWFQRQIGETLTISLNLKENQWTQNGITVQWQRNYEVYKKIKPLTVVIQKDKSPWNIAVGSAGLELRISPITDTDMDFNSFKAIVYKGKQTPNNNTQPIGEVIFRINVIPIEMGFVYPGEELLINIENHISLPSQSLTYEWFLENEFKQRGFSLPSNMRPSKTKTSLSIKEFRDEQHGIISCAVYSVRRLFIAKRRFRIKAEGKLEPETTKFLSNSQKKLLRDKILQLGRLSPKNERHRIKREELIKKINPSYFYTKRMEGNDNYNNINEKNLVDNSIISRCISKEQCSRHGQCHMSNKEKIGYCECSNGYHGNGLFCWENIA